MATTGTTIRGFRSWEQQCLWLVDYNAYSIATTVSTCRVANDIGNLYFLNEIKNKYTLNYYSKMYINAYLERN